MKYRIKFLIVTIATSTLFGCGLGDKAEKVRQMAEAAQERLEAGDSAGALGAFLGGGETVQPVDFRDLRELLPEKAGGLPRTNVSGEKSSMMGIGTSKVEGRYEEEKNRSRIDLSITDFGSMRGITMMGFGWTMVDIDKESENGYEKTIEYEGYPAYVKYEQGSDWSRGQMSVVVVDRFVVTASGSNVSDDQIRDALESVDIDRLEDMKDAGVGEAAPERPDVADFTPPDLPAEEDASEREQPQSMGDVLTRMNEGQEVDPIDFRELKAMLPEELDGMARTNAEGEKGGTMGIIQSSATGTYQPEGDRRTSIEITIKDMGALKGAMAMGGYSWLMMQTDKESDTGFERTTEYKGFPAFESYSTKGHPRGKIETVIGKRFVVEVHGRNVAWEQIREAIDQVDVQGLAARKDEGVTPAS